MTSKKKSKAKPNELEPVANTLLPNEIQGSLEKWAETPRGWDIATESLFIALLTVAIANKWAADNPDVKKIPMWIWTIALLTAGGLLTVLKNTRGSLAQAAVLTTIMTLIFDSAITGFIDAGKEFVEDHKGDLIAVGVGGVAGYCLKNIAEGARDKFIEQSDKAVSNGRE